MNVIRTNIEGVLILEPRLIKTKNGYFFEQFSEKEFNEKVYEVKFCQDNESMNRYGVVGGFHFQRPPFAQNKLNWCVTGKIIDVAVDIRKGSPTYGQYVAVELSADNHRQLFIPQGFAHGYSVLSENTIIQYKCDNFYHPESEDGFSILNNEFNIDWKVKADNIVLSKKDTKYKIFKDFESPFDF